MSGSIWKRFPLPRPRVRRWIGLVCAAFLATVAAVALASYTRQFAPPRDRALSLAELTHLDFTAYGLGMAFLNAIVPVALLFIFGNTSVFRRFIRGPSTPGDRRKMLLGLVLVQLLAYGYSQGLALLVHEPPQWSCLVLVSLVVVTGGLLGGWRVGLTLGLVGVLLRSTVRLICFLNVQADEVSLLLQSEGLRSLLRPLWGDMLLHSYVRSPLSVPVLWTGLFSGLVADVLGKHRLSPLAALLLGAVVSLGDKGLMTIAIGEISTPELVMPGTLVAALAMAVIALIVHRVLGRIAEQEAAASELARTRAELMALRAQINPHFLFNALNTIRYFVRTDQEAARRLLLHLSEVFQRALHSGEFVPLQDELGYVEAYLALEQARLGERLQVEWSLSAKDRLEYPVPTLILQPVVENAVIHGIAQKPGGGTVRIVVEEVGSDLVLQVEDEGLGIDVTRLAGILGPGQENGEAIGLRNIDGRLRALYGEEYRLIIESEVGRGTCVKIRVPIGG